MVCTFLCFLAFFAHQATAAFAYMALNSGCGGGGGYLVVLVIFELRIVSRLMNQHSINQFPHTSPSMQGNALPRPQLTRF